jgi:hypothetical protein
MLGAGLHVALPGIAAGLPMAPLVSQLLHPRPTGRPTPEQVLAQLSSFART